MTATSCLVEPNKPASFHDQASRRLPRLRARPSKQTNHLPVERGDVVRATACNQALVHHHFLVYPLRVGVPRVGLERWSCSPDRHDADGADDLAVPFERDAARKNHDAARTSFCGSVTTTAGIILVDIHGFSPLSGCDSSIRSVVSMMYQGMAPAMGNQPTVRRKGSDSRQDK
jgi:hypothetical protein